MQNKNSKLIIANWKMNPLFLKEALSLAKASDKAGVILCVPYIFLGEVKKVIKKAKLGAQDANFEEKGAYTGEISSEMLANLGVKYVILGHSEKRASGDVDEIINKKVKAVLASGMIPILCVGEKERDEKHEYLNIIKKQITENLAGVSKNSLSKIIIAYEPVWAIGKNAVREATPAEFLEMKIFIKKVLTDMYGAKAEMPKIIYGGSVDEKNSLNFSTEGQSDGFLIGRACLDSKKFNKILSLL